MKIYVEEEFETIRTIIRDRASISRFGDGEFRVACGGNCKTQTANPTLARHLKRILIEDTPGLLVAIPRVFGRHDLIRYNEKRHFSWVDQMSRKKFQILLKPKKKYYSSFISRSDSAPHIDCDLYWNLCKQIWKGRKVLFISSANIDKYKIILSDAAEFNFLTTPEHSSFSIADDIVQTVLRYSKETLIYLSLGVAATSLAYTICKLGYQVIDFGQWGKFYTGTHHKVIRTSENNMIHPSDLFKVKDPKNG